MNQSEQKHLDSILPPKGEEPKLLPVPQKKKAPLFVASVLIVAITIAVLVLGFKAGLTFNLISIKNKLAGSQNSDLFVQAESLHRDPDRINILIIGIRGADDPHGGLLSDLLVLVSIDKKKEEVSLVSIPRDLYVEIPGLERRERINYAYAYGEQKERGGGGVGLSKKVVAEVTGVYIDYAVSVDFTAFERVIDELGGIDVYVPQDFHEPTQWGYPFSVPKGWNHMNSETALYYVRSRFSSSDFDRARREQEVLVAIKNKALSLNVLANPVKIYNFLDIVGNHVFTDIDSGDLKNLVQFASHFEPKEIKRKVLDTSPEGLLYPTTTEKGAYILLPVGGNFDQIQSLVIDVFEEEMR